ncbi:MAG TPA: cell division protein ZapE [Longimicrobiales bacterium]
MSGVETAGPTLDALLRSLPARPDARGLVERFVPPPRFAGKRFESYRPDPRYPSQAVALARLRAAAEALHDRGLARLARRTRERLGRPRRGRGIYLDGGFGVGKTHLLAALWNAAPGPKAYLSFDELVYTIGLVGVGRAREAFRGLRLVAIDEWELDDPGNLKLAVAFLRGALADGIQVAATSNAVPYALGRGGFSQKDFAAEIDELAAAFEVVRVEGEDYRHRAFAADPGHGYFVGRLELAAAAERAGPGALHVAFPALLGGLGRVHPIRYAALVERLDALLVEDVTPIDSLPQALRWVHFVDKLYDAAVPFAASGGLSLGELFPASFLDGPYAKKFSRCLSRLEELLGQGIRPAETRESA